MEVHLARPALHGNDLEIGANAVMLVEQACELGDRHPMAHGHAELTYE